MPRKLGFREACSKYPNRYTMEHVPDWAHKEAPGRKYYAPQFRTDREWYEHTEFPPHPMCYQDDCYTSGQTWPLGQWLDAPYTKEVK